MRKQIVISGAGSGIGKAAAETLARDPDASLVLVGRRREALEATRALLPRAGEHRTVPLDVAGLPESAAELRSLLTNDLYAVLANHGVGGENHAGADDRWNEILATNLSGTYHLVETCRPFLEASPHPWRHVVITASVLARIGVPAYSAYCASKAGLLGLTRSWAAEWASRRILVNALCPGWVETEMARAGLEKMAANDGTTYEAAYRAQMAFVPTGKMAQPSEVAATIEFLLSGKQTSFTGQAIDLNNGAWMG